MTSEVPAPGPEAAAVALPGSAPVPLADPVPPDDRPDQVPGAPPGDDGPPRPRAVVGHAVLEIPLGRRMLVVGDLLLPAEACSSSVALADDVAATLEDWQGPGAVVICGNLFAGQCPKAPLTAQSVAASLAAHPQLTGALTHFAGADDRSVIVLPGWRDPEVATDPDVVAALGQVGIAVATTAELRLTTAAGERRVLVEPGRPTAGADRLVDPAPPASRPWLEGIDRLEDPAASASFVTSRVLYRRFGRLSVILALTPAALAILLRLPFIFTWLDHLLAGAPVPRRAIYHAFSATWTSRVLVALGSTALVVAVMTLVLAVASRYAWTALGGARLPRPWARPWPNPRPETFGDPPPSNGLQVGGLEALDWARTLMAAGAAGLVAGGGLRAELSHLGSGFYASPGGTTEVVREHPGRFGLPPVFVHHRQVGWIELETGADLHVRLLAADIELPTSTLLERLATSDHVVKGKKPAADLHPAMVASWPRGASWPPAPAVAANRVRVRRIRRVAAAAIFLAGLVDLLIAVTPPLRGHLQLVQRFLPLGVSQAAGALVALAGIGLMMLARGVLRGQRRSWVVASALLAATGVLHLIHGIDVAGVVVSAAVLLLLLAERRSFGTAARCGSVRAATVTLALTAGLVVLVATATTELTGRVRHQRLPGWPRVFEAVTERLVGLTTVALPSRIDSVLAPTLLGLGIALIVVVLYQLTRPVLDARLSTTRVPGARRAADLRARDIVRRHGTGTLDYFALRDDKEWFFHRDSLVAYGVYGSICLVSPDPIGPYSERAHVWDAFRHFADRNGWVVAVMAAAEEWLSIYRHTGMHHIYIGDEGVVDIRRFSLQGGKMKGLRQAVNRVARYGYTVEFTQPAAVTPDEVTELVDLLGRNRRGEDERGFSMMLGRIFDPRDAELLLTVVRGPGGEPVAMCQFVPSKAIGGYSLDLMRRDPGEHPNGLLDFALCSTIDHLKAQGARGLSLNFAAMRSTLEGETGDGLTQRAERWALRRLSGVLQIESLWKFNAKYEPTWLPRYIVFDSAEHFVPTAVQIMRAESLTEMPVIGRMLSPGSRRIPSA